MPRFTVEIAAVASVWGRIEIEAPDQEAAEAAALARTGDIKWHYNGLLEGESVNCTPDVTEIEPL